MGNIDIQRDWGWTEDYVEVMYCCNRSSRMTVRSRWGRVISWLCLLRLRLGWWGWIGGRMWASDKGLCRPTDLAVSRGNPSKAILVPSN
jgi:GDPmannose 4,6-dehydratase